VIVHAIAGRTRIRLPINNLLPAQIEARLRNLPNVTAASYSSITNTAVLYHEETQLNRRIIKEIPALFTENLPQVVETQDKVSSIKGQVRDFGLVLGTLLVERFFLPNLSLKFLSPSSMAILFVSRKIIKDGLLALPKPNADTLTTASLAASLLKGSPKSAFIIYAMSSLSEILTEYTANKTRGFVKDMMEIDAKEAWLVANNGEHIKVSADIIKKGDKIIVFQGEKISFDGTVTDYSGEVEQSSITGEYMPVFVEKDSYVYAGSILTDGKIVIEVENVGEDLAVNRMIKLIEEAQDKQADIQQLSERIAQKAVPISFGLAGLIYILTKDWSRVLNMLVIDYVCGIKLSTATAISASIGKAARKGILVKGGQTLEELSKVNTIVFDKTGTITEGRPVVTSISAYNGYTENKVIAIAASAEEHSSHPIALAILNEAKQRDIKALAHEDQTMQNIVGKGISVYVEDQHVLVGSRKLMKDYHIDIKDKSKSGIYIAQNEQLIGILEIEDQVRVGMNRTLNHMRRTGVDEIIMLTGDYKEAAKKVANRLSVDEFFAEALPEEKAKFLKNLKEEEGRVTMMVGDGINDAPALAHANIGVSLGAKKTDIAMETSDIVIHSDNPVLLADAVNISHDTMKVIKQNIVATFAVNTLAIAFGSVGVFPPIIGATIHNAATIGVVLNAARLLLGGKKPNAREIHD